MGIEPMGVGRIIRFPPLLPVLMVPDDHAHGLFSALFRRFPEVEGKIGEYARLRRVAPAPHAMV